MKKIALAATIGLSLTALAAGPASAAGAASEEDSTIREADLALKFRTMTPLEVTQGKGVEYTIDGLKKGDVVLTSLDNELTTVEEDGPFDGAAAMDEKPKTDSNVEFTVTLKRGDEPDRVFPARVRIIEGDRGDYDDGTLVMDPDSTMLDEGLYQEGLNLTMVNCSADDQVHFTVSRKDADGKKKVWEKSQLAGEDESASVRYMPKESMPKTGEYEAVAKCGDLSDSAKVTVDPTEPPEE